MEAVELYEEMEQSYVAYAMSVIVGRALPDARDGLKPVHRRVLYVCHPPLPGPRQYCHYCNCIVSTTAPFL